MRVPSEPLVSVIIPTLNAGEQIASLLDALKAQQLPGYVELVVIDSGSKDSTRELARRAGARVLMISRREFNHGRARNKAIEAARGEFVALTVQDAEPSDSHWLARLLAPLLEQPDLAGSYGLQAAPPTSNLLARTRTALWQSSHGDPVIKSVGSPEDLDAIEPQQRLDMVRFDNVTSCVRRAVWELIPLPESGYGEDMGWAKRVLLAGYRLAYVPAAKVWHAHERSWRYEFRRAFLDGCWRVRLVDWPGLPLRLGEVADILRWMASLMLTDRFDVGVDQEQMRSFLDEPSTATNWPVGSNKARIYEEIKGFTNALTETALGLSAADALPPGAWTTLFRFAAVCVVGQHLGAAAAAELEQSRPHGRFALVGLERILGRGV